MLAEQNSNTSAGAMPAVKLDSPANSAVIVDSTDVESNATEVSKSTEPGELIDAASSDAGSTGTAPGPASPPQLKLAVPEPIEQAGKLAVVAIQDWWAQLLPVLAQLQAQMLQMCDPYLKASAKGFAQLQTQLKPYTAPAEALAAEWAAKLEPHAKVAMEQTKLATEFMRVQAWEPALVAINAASASISQHAQAGAVIVSEKAVLGFNQSKEWVAAQKPLLEQMHTDLLAHAAQALAALEAWRVEITPLLVEQMKVAQVKALEMSQEAGKKAEELSRVTHQQLLVLSAEAAKRSAEVKAAAAPHVEKAGKWVEEKSKEAYVHIEPHVKPVQVWSDEQAKKLAPYTAPVGKALNDMGTVVSTQWWPALVKQWPIWMKQIEQALEGPTKATQQWLAQTMQCLCLPIQQQLGYKGGGAAATGEYEKPVGGGLI